MNTFINLGVYNLRHCFCPYWHFTKPFLLFLILPHCTTPICPSFSTASCQYTWGPSVKHIPVLMLRHLDAVSMCNSVCIHFMVLWTCSHICLIVQPQPHLLFLSTTPPFLFLSTIPPSLSVCLYSHLLFFSFKLMYNVIQINVIFLDRQTAEIKCDV